MSSRIEEEKDPDRLLQVTAEEERGLARRKGIGLDFNPREMTPAERLAAEFVTQGVRDGRIKTDQEIRLVAADGEALRLYHEQIEGRYEDSKAAGGTMIEVRDHMLPEDVLTEVVDGEARRVPLRLVTVTFAPREV